MSQVSPVDPVKLARLAETIVKVGLGLKPGQDLFLTAPISAAPLVRLVVEEAYKAGAGLVTPLYGDEKLTLARFVHGQDQSFDRAPGWLYKGVAEAFSEGTARLALVGDDPMLLAEQDPDKVSRANRATSRAYKPALEHISNFRINWSIAAWPGATWAKRVFPDLPEDEAVRRLAEAIFAASRVDGPDPVAAWAAHNAALKTRSAWLNGKRFSALRFRGPGTDLTVGLADGHEWHGGANSARNGVVCNPNIPTEEVFTTPHKLRVEGHVSSTKPLSHQGALLDGIRVTFREGRIVEAHAARGEAVLQKLIDTDEGARRLGEVALVPHGSPISASGLLFYNTLFDENAACHIALGQCYSECFVGGASLSEEQIAAQGGNSSLIHVDWMIGSGEIDIDGLDEKGAATPVFRKGEWA
ncbi:aminopeptidase [Neomegalonema sp.]|uniref:aminopeptidase n=1 Tax=Neomegalonema sp. TaxID=2039713 RepID=UPI002609EFB3|nr:aminopeptidase [Neomegalonema sp.]MDD2868621.1 aminopeptidase [Neomegalonema sp.]